MGHPHHKQYVNEYREFLFFVSASICLFSFWVKKPKKYFITKTLWHYILRTTGVFVWWIFLWWFFIINSNVSYDAATFFLASGVVCCINFLVCIYPSHRKSEMHKTKNWLKVKMLFVIEFLHFLWCNPIQIHCITV